MTSKSRKNLSHKQSVLYLWHPCKCGFLNSRKRLRPESVFLAFTEQIEINRGKIVEKQMPRDYRMNQTYDVFEPHFEFSDQSFGEELFSVKEFMRFRKKLGTVFSKSSFMSFTEQFVQNWKLHPNPNPHTWNWNFEYSLVFCDKKTVVQTQT